MKNISKKILKSYTALALLIFPGFLFAQDTLVEPAAAPTKEYMKRTFENTVALNNQTVENVSHKSLDFMIQHRFALIKNSDDLYGFYGPSNIRLGLTYGVTKFLALGVGVTKNKMIYDFNAKANILKQTKGKGCPVSLTYYGSIGRSALDDNAFINQDSVYKSQNRLTFFNEIIVGRKLNSKFSVQVAFTYSHMNLVDSIYQQHDFYSVALLARYKFSPQSSVMFDYDYVLNASDIDASVRPKPNFTIGYEVSTGSHQFQIFVGTAQQIVNEEYRVYNQNQFVSNKNDVFKMEVLFGFNITRDWSFK
jgi:hypothetical protein